MGLERGKIHFKIEHAIYESCNLALGNIRKTCNKKIRNVISKENRIGLAWWCSGWVKERDGNLVHLDQMKHVTEKRGMHFKPGLM